jgi:GPH family glycoside/pentoside/hexuronide:cation symporter
MTQKFGQALGIFTVGQLVAYVGLGERVRPEDWPASAATTMGWIVAGLMILIAIMAAAGLRRYAIDRAGHEARLAALAAARNEASKP